MLNKTKVVTTIAVTDIAKARKFYEDTLKLKPYEAEGPEKDQGVEYHLKDGTKIYLYESEYAGTAKHTLASFESENLDELVDWLRGRGIEFEEFEMPGVTWDNGVATMGDMSGAWFSDPDGNILAVATPVPVRELATH